MLSFTPRVIVWQCTTLMEKKSWQRESVLHSANLAPLISFSRACAQAFSLAAGGMVSAERKLTTSFTLHFSIL